MNAERREQVEAVCADALEREGDARPRFVEEACRGDEELRGLVNWLLGEHSRADGFLEEPPWRPLDGTSTASAGFDPIPPGTLLGPYAIDSLVGAGGMGEVYKARDTRLGRTVAIKVLPRTLAADTESRRRFEQEARAASALSHPHICTLYDVGLSAGPQPGGEPISFLVMEYLAGETLAARLRKGPLPIAETLLIGSQVASALTAAHRQGIIHRDLKPGNVMLTKSGAKLLDFGIAKLIGRDAEPTLARPGADNSASDPTAEAKALTRHGLIVGTVQCMAPEQLEGRPPDGRTDIWALGVILYEMLTGHPAFEGDSTASLMTAIREREPLEISSLQPLTPPSVDRLIRKCLAKDPDARWQTAADVADELRWLAGGSGVSSLKAQTPGAQPSGLARPTPTWLVAAALAGVALGGVAGGWLWHRITAASSPAPSVERLDVALEDTGISMVGQVAVSPDGQAIVFAGGDRQSRLYVRNRRAWSTKVLEGTDGANSVCFSPDGLSVAFMTSKGLYRSQIGGGAPVVVDDEEGRGRSEGLGLVGCGPDGSLVFASITGSRLWRVPANGGRAEALDRPGELDEAARYSSPQLLPGGRTVIFTKTLGGRSEAVAFSLATRRITLLADRAVEARFVQSGHLVYEVDHALVAVPFDADRLTRVGEPQTLETDVGAWDVSPTTLAFGSPAHSRLSWRDRSGAVVRLAVPIPDHIYQLALAPDGRRAVLAVEGNSRRSHQVYRLDLDGVANAMRLTPGDDDWFGVFTPDGTRVLYTSPQKEGGSNRYNVFSTPADGSGTPVRLTGGRNWQKATAVRGTGTGELFLYNLMSLTERDPGTAVPGLDFDVWQALTHGSEEGARAVVATTGHDEFEATLSPDGKWIAYESNEAGRQDVYVKGYPDGPRSLITPDGGGRPIWNPKTGRELFYQKDSSVFTVTVLDGKRVGTPARLFDRGLSSERNWDVAPDGQRFLVAEDVGPRGIKVVTNWSAELKAKASAAR